MQTIKPSVMHMYEQEAQEYLEELEAQAIEWQSEEGTTYESD